MTRAVHDRPSTCQLCWTWSLFTGHYQSWRKLCSVRPRLEGGCRASDAHPNKKPPVRRRGRGPHRVHLIVLPPVDRALHAPHVKPALLLRAPPPATAISTAAQAHTGTVPQFGRAAPAQAVSGHSTATQMDSSAAAAVFIHVPHMQRALRLCTRLQLPSTGQPGCGQPWPHMHCAV